MRGSWRSLLPFTLALLVGVGNCQRDLSGHVEQNPTYLTESRNREATRLRIRNQVSAGSANKVFNLFQAHHPSSASDHVPVSSQADMIPSAGMRSLAGRENRRSPSAYTDQRLSAATNVRSQSSIPGPRLDASGRSLSGTLQQRQRMDSSHQRQRNGFRSRTVPQPRVPLSRNRMAG